ncbi:hypothetical protein GALMADRAFT_208082 [Galerina marginata CBS 339.88]|uniref:Uncharacterized protein n=1 Tax=Galerina marginata (strain CBS 339.88) TaxID=685588 RepID=A0A067TQS5_GALM3|nr:hypothetical protein GALMADRAFT_208082 [Galerina marginata CBS 339.88]
MQFKVVFLSTALLAFSSLALSATITGFGGAACTGPADLSNALTVDECLIFGNHSQKSLSYSGVTNEIKFYIFGNCTYPNLVFGGGSGCATAPQGFSWGSVMII